MDINEVYLKLGKEMVRSRWKPESREHFSALQVLLNPMIVRSTWMGRPN
jgi:hypothetical protein